MMLVAGAVLVLLLVGIGLKIWEFNRGVGRIPTPKSHPIVGNLFPFLADIDNALTKVQSLIDKHYPIYRLTSFFVNIAAIIEPNDIELVLSSTKHMTKSRVYSYLNSWLGTGLLTSKGKKWHRRRKILTPAFHFDILQKFVAIFNDETEKLVEILEQTSAGQPISVVPLVTNFTLCAVAETAMGLKDVTKESFLHYKEAVYRIGQILVNRIKKPWWHLQSIYNLSSLGKEEKGVVKILRNFSSNIISTREKEVPGEAKPKRLAMLDLLLTAKNDGANIDNEGIREEVDTFMFEGHDTTSMAISFILLTLANQSQAQSQILEEILTVVGPTNPPTFQNLQSLKYTERCIKECLRLFPSVPFISRRAGEDFQTTTGYTIPKNTILHIYIFNLHRNPILYPDPLKFDPDRFLPENVSKRHPFAYIPFSAGPRNCIGQRFAILELKAALCGILRRFELEKVDDMYEVKFKADLVLRPQSDIRIKIKKRTM